MQLPRMKCFTHRFCVSGLNLERLINLLSRNDIPLLRLSRTDAKTLECECYSHDLAQITAIAADKGWRIHAAAPLRWSSRLARLRLRPGLLIGCVLAVLTAAILSGFIWRVEMLGAGSYQAEITSYLKENGYVPGRNRRTFDASALEQALTYRYPQIAWFHVYVSGVTLVVEVSQGVPMPALPGEGSSDIVAQHGGIVQQMRVYAGTAAVKPGEIVQKGQVLIRGTERSADGQTVPVAAAGVVQARCWRSHTVHMPLYEILSEETGRKVQVLRIRTPYGQQPVSSPAFLAYNTYMETLPVAGCFFPVMVDLITQREVSMQYRPRSIETVQQEAAQAALKHLKTGLFGYDIIDKWVEYCMIEGDTLAATATVEWLMDIAQSP